MRIIFLFILLFGSLFSYTQEKTPLWANLAPPDTIGKWIQPAQGKEAMPIWGHPNGLTIGLAPMPGPRGLIRIYAHYLGLDMHDVMNFIALEPITTKLGYRSLSELEMSTLDAGKMGKRFWSSNTSDDTSPLNELYPARGVIKKINGEETLTFYIFSEPFDDGAKVYVRIRFFESRPYEFEITSYTYDDCEQLDCLITTATMGNKARLRTVYLNDYQKTSLELWPGYKDVNFAPHEIFLLNDMIRDKQGKAYFIAAPNERDYTKAKYDPETAPNWYFKGIFATQFWIKENPTDKLEGLVNGRYTYWTAKAPIPGGISFENFEMKEPFRNGSTSIFGIIPEEPETLIRKWKSSK